VSGVTSAIQTQIDSKTGIADNETITGNWIFNNIITGSITGNAGTVTNGAYINVTNSFTSTQNILATTNQLVLGTTNTTTISATAPAASAVYTIPDVGTTADFVLTAGTQTIAGAKTFSGAITLSGGVSGNIDATGKGFFNNTLKVTGNLSGSDYEANSLLLDNNAGNSRLYSVGPDAATRGSYEIIGRSSDGSSISTYAVITNGGNVGIGTVSPDSKLHVEGQASGSIFSALKLSNNVNADGSGVSLEFADVLDIVTTKVESLRNGTSYSLGFYTTSSSTLSEKVRILGNGNVGIGTVSPVSLLQVQRTTSAAADQVGGIIRVGSTFSEEEVSGAILFAEQVNNANFNMGIAYSGQDNALYFLGPGAGTTDTGASGSVIDAYDNRRWGSIARDTGAWTLGPSSSSTTEHRVHGHLGIGKDAAAAFSTPGIVAFSVGSINATRSAGNPLDINRTGNDGNLVLFYQNTVAEGSITVSGTTVSYNGAHLSRWSQFNDKSSPVILRGTVMSSTGQMADWDGEENEQLTCSQVSSVVGDTQVSGVFDMYDVDDQEDNPQDFYVAQTGDFIIRVAANANIQVGDLLDSAGDGTAKPQADTIVRSSTIAKVMSTQPSTTYEDGSRCVPCLLMIC
jgi:hypothetical protein